MMLYELQRLYNVKRNGGEFNNRRKQEEQWEIMNDTTERD